MSTRHTVGHFAYTASFNWHINPEGFSRQEHWSRLPFPSPGDLPDPGKRLDPHLLSLAISGGFFTTKPPERLNEASALIFTDERA